MYRIVDVQESIKTQRITFVDSVVEEFCNVSFYVGTNIFSWSIFAYVVYYELYEVAHSDLLSLFFSVILLASWCVVLFYISVTRRKLTRVTTLTKESILQDLQTIDWEVVHQTPDYVVIKPDLFRQITLIFDNDDVYIHALSEGRGFIYRRLGFLEKQFLKKIRS